MTTTSLPAHAHPTDTTRLRNAGYWISTGVLAFCMTGGVFELLSLKTTVDGITRLGYPAYVIPLLGLGKVLAMVAIVWPRTPKLKEWAYAGLTFNMIGATVSHLACKDPLWSVAVTVGVLGLVMASWALRPESRRS